MVTVSVDASAEKKDNSAKLLPGTKGREGEMSQITRGQNTKPGHVSGHTDEEEVVKEVQRGGWLCGGGALVCCGGRAACFVGSRGLASLNRLGTPLGTHD